MPVKSKTVHEEDFARPEDIFARERAMKQLDACWRALSEFYGFERVRPVLIERRGVFVPLEKAGIFFERRPIFVSLPGMNDGMLRCSIILSLAQMHAAHHYKEMHGPIRLCGEGMSFFLNGKNTDEVLTSKEEYGLFTAGEKSVSAETVVIHVLWKMLEDIGMPLEHLHVALNATGCSQCRARFRTSFLAYMRTRMHRICKSCRKNIKIAPTSIYHCSEEQCAHVASQAPRMLDFLCELCRERLRGILEFLDEVNISYILHANLFREGSWYNTFVFEIIFSDGISAQGEHTASSPVILAEGGGIARLGELIIGERLDAVGGVFFPEDAHRILNGRQSFLREQEQAHVVFAHLGELAQKKAFHIAETLRRHSIATTFSFGQGSLKAQLKAGDRMRAAVTLIFGQKEALDGTIILREMRSGIQETIPQEKLIEFLKKKLKK